MNLFGRRGGLRLPMASFIKRLQLPRISDSITEVTLLRYFKQVGDYIKQDDELAEVESHKGAMSVRAEAGGVITKHLVQPNTDIVVGADFVEIDETAAEPTASSEAIKAVGLKPDKREEPSAEGKSTTFKPDKREEPPAESKSAALKPTKREEPPSESKSTALKPTPTLDSPRPAVLPQKEAVSALNSGRTETRERMSRIRRTTAERLKTSQNTYATVSTFQELDMSSIMDMRKEFGEDFKTRHGVKLGLMSFFIKACSAALRERPVVNAVIDDQTHEIVYRSFVDISVAVSGPKGLLVPVLRNCESLGFAQIENKLADFGTQAKSGMVSLEDMAGGTFTISNGGVFGSMLSIPIINPPQSAVLGMHNIVNRPVVRQGEIVARPIMYISLSYDHRLLDGREGVGFLRRVADLLEDPRKMLFDSL